MKNIYYLLNLKNFYHNQFFNRIKITLFDKLYNIIQYQLISI